MQKNKRIITLLIAIAIILMIPLIGQWPWTISDFIVSGTLLIGTAIIFEWAIRNGGSKAHRAAVGMALAATLMLIWINLAVGIIGNENNPANLLYFGVILIGIIGTFMARLESKKMSRTLFAMAIAQFFVPLIALAIWKPKITSWEINGILGVFILNTFFVIMFIGSALLFKNSISNKLK